MSIVFVVIALVVLVAFVSLAVDIGRMRLAGVQLQTAADAAAFAGGRALEFLPSGVDEPETRAVETAARNLNIDVNADGGGRLDSDVTLVPDEDIEFGIWRTSTLTFHRLESNGSGVDERRESNAIRVWGRRVTTFEHDGDVITRNTSLPLIFGPVIGVFRGEIQQHAVAMIRGGRTGYGFVGLDFIKMNGTTLSDSYNAAAENYPGVNGPNELGSISSNGDITLVGTTDIFGDVHPGVNGSLLPYPLGDNVDITGHMTPLEAPLVFPLPPFSPPGTNNNSTGVTPPNAVKPSGAFQAANNTTIAPGNYVFTSWTAGSQDKVTLDNTSGPITVWVNGNFRNSAQAELHLKSNANQVTFHINGNFDMQGGGVINDQAGGALPSNLLVNVTKANTTVDIGGSPATYMHLYAPGSAIKLHGNGGEGFGFFGWAIGKSLTVNGNMEIHYDESGPSAVTPFSVHLVD